MTSPDDLTTGRFSATPADLQQPLPEVETSRPVANRETPRETSAAKLQGSCRCPGCGSLDVSSLGGGVDRCATCGTTWRHATAANLENDRADFKVEPTATAALRKRRLLANLARGFAPSYSSCYRCGMPWKFTESHSTRYGDGGHGCFPLCEPCWSELTPETRLPFYERLIEDWNGKYGCPVEHETAEAIREAVMAGG